MSPIESSGARPPMDGLGEGKGPQRPRESNAGSETRTAPIPGTDGGGGGYSGERFAPESPRGDSSGVSAGDYQKVANTLEKLSTSSISGSDNSHGSPGVEHGSSQTNAEFRGQVAEKSASQGEKSGEGLDPAERKSAYEQAANNLERQTAGDAGRKEPQGEQHDEQAHDPVGGRSDGRQDASPHAGERVGPGGDVRAMGERTGVTDRGTRSAETGEGVQGREGRGLDSRYKEVANKLEPKTPADNHSVTLCGDNYTTGIDRNGTQWMNFSCPGDSPSEAAKSDSQAETSRDGKEHENSPKQDQRTDPQTHDRKTSSDTGQEKDADGRNTIAGTHETGRTEGDATGSKQVSGNDGGTSTTEMVEKKEPGTESAKGERNPGTRAPEHEPHGVPARDVVYERLGHDFAYKFSAGNVAELRGAGYRIDLNPKHTFSDQKTGFSMTAFVPLRESSHLNPVLAFRGTQQGRDFVDDFHRAEVGHNQWSANTEKVATALKELRASYGKVDVAGHSLGGSHAQHAGAENPECVDRIVTFNSPGIPADTVRRLENYNASHDPSESVRSTHYRVAGDVVDNAGQAFTPGTVTEFPGPTGIGPAALTATLNGMFGTLGTLFGNELAAHTHHPLAEASQIGGQGVTQPTEAPGTARPFETARGAAGGAAGGAILSLDIFFK